MIGVLEGEDQNNRHKKDGSAASDGDPQNGQFLLRHLIGRILGWRAGGPAGGCLLGYRQFRTIPGLDRTSHVKLPKTGLEEEERKGTIELLGEKAVLQTGMDCRMRRGRGTKLHFIRTTTARVDLGLNSRTLPHFAQGPMSGEVPREDQNFGDLSSLSIEATDDCRC